MAEVSRAIKFLGTALPVAAGILGGVGFLSIRSFVNGIGLPEHVTLSVDEYLQYGGRVFFGLIFQLLPLAAVLAAVVILFDLAVKHAPFVSRITDHFFLPPALALALASVGIYYETDLLSGRPLFLPWSVRDALISRSLLHHFYFVEAACAVTGVWLFVGFASRWNNVAGSSSRKAFLSFTLLAISSEILLLCPCFGRIAMIPDNFIRVVLQRKEMKPVEGLLLFSDKDSYFLYTPDCMMVEVPHADARQLDYEAQQRPEDACKR